ncbi:hypothetical protein SAMN04489724_3578 [Algoriphagus locisalis]|uniref:Uncharacterized protein n=1 Tax=Algoriphagus locisalis TaxID=305507 RepID=A0A1I7CYC9_9BACT|nr:hypothetical protein [Algoriphagus locisalis]SFU04448.1 hypothetical protein SAMN04489724_3578 [Algoriphagus locisalis]
MKTAIFTWLFLLPLQIYATTYSARLSENMIPKAPQSQELTGAMDAMNLELISSAEQEEANGNFQAIAVSQEKHIQKLKSQLAHKNHEIYSQELEQWKFQTSTLIFFVGMLLFAFLYIRSKIIPTQPEMARVSNLYSQEK